MYFSINLIKVRIIYSFLVSITWFVLKPITYLNPKIKLFVDGRKNAFTTLKKSISSTDKIIWMHVASLGEYEQGLPILKELRKTYPEYKLLLTFFSPSGFEVKKDTNTADIVCYLPLDTITNATKFIKIAKPKMALFIKYEIWPNYLTALKKKEIPTFLVSALFNKKQVYFKWYGGFMRKNLYAFTQIFVQDKNSKQLLNNSNITNVIVSGDTRFDRVSEILKQNNTLSFMDNFKQNNFCFVVGSSWPEDEEIITSFINNSDEKIKFVIAPHNINKEQIRSLKTSFSKKTLLYSELAAKNSADFDVLIINSIGLLTKIYNYADIAYVGGAFKTGLHNTLEPAVFGIPIIVGPNYKGFKEAEDLVAKGGILPIKNKKDFTLKIEQLRADKNALTTTGAINTAYVDDNIGATIKIIKYLKTVL